MTWQPGDRVVVATEYRGRVGGAFVRLEHREVRRQRWTLALVHLDGEPVARPVAVERVSRR